MGILGSKNKANTSPVEEAPKEVQRKSFELLGREFHIVKDGLDPKEVMEFLEASTGSSEAAFKHLEQFSAVQSVARTMEESIAEARQMAEQARAKAKIEIDRERTKATAEIQLQSSTILDETMKSCIASVEGVHSVILDAVARTDEIHQEAFRKTREMVAVNMAEIQRNIQASMGGQYHQTEADTEATEDSPDLPTKPDTIVFNEVEEQETEEEEPDKEETEEDEPDEEPVFDLSNLQESLMSLELSLSNLNESKNALEPVAETKVHVLDRVEAEETEEADDIGEAEEAEGIEEAEETEDEVQPADTESHDDSQQDNVHQYSGEVTVQIIGGAEESWMQELRKRVLDLPGVRIRAESGVDEKTTMVSLSLGEPVGLFPILLSLPRVNRVVPGRLNGGKEGMKLRLWPKSHKNGAQNTITVELHSNGNTPPAMAESEDNPTAAS